MASEGQASDMLSEGRRLMQEGDYKGAVARFDEVMALETEPMTLASAHLNRLDALRKLGREQGAQAAEANWESVKRAALERLSSWEPSNETARSPSRSFPIEVATPSMASLTK